MIWTIKGVFFTFFFRRLVKITATIKVRNVIRNTSNAQCKTSAKQWNCLKWYMMINRKFLPTRVRCKANVQFSCISAVTPLAVQEFSVKWVYFQGNTSFHTNIFIWRLTTDIDHRRVCVEKRSGILKCQVFCLSANLEYETDQMTSSLTETRKWFQLI